MLASLSTESVIADVRPRAKPGLRGSGLVPTDCHPRPLLPTTLENISSEQVPSALRSFKGAGSAG
jgi:hypothetical protein